MRDLAFSALGAVTVAASIAGCTIALPPFISPSFPAGTNAADAVRAMKALRIESATLDLSRFDEFVYTRQYVECVADPGDVLEAHITRIDSDQYVLRAVVEAPTAPPLPAAPNCISPMP